MVSYECSKCNGRGYEEEIRIRGNDVEKVNVRCNSCDGAGIIRNGEPSHWEKDTGWSPYR